jgi:hypothetical protein
MESVRCVINRDCTEENYENWIRVVTQWAVGRGMDHDNGGKHRECHR